MPTGTIKKHFGNKGYGFIVPDDGGSDLFFHAKDKGNESFNQLREKDRVAFDVARSEKGLAAVFVKPIVATHAANSYAMQDEPKETSHEETNAYRFLNPYNFVRFLTPVGVTKGPSKATGPIGEKLLALGLKGEAQQEVSDTVQHLLGKCAPPPHDRYVGLSGKITCTLKTETPLFISDAEGILKKPLDDGKEHKTYRFFQAEQAEQAEHRYLIPASSLRGMIRNVFEAVTNSCMAIFDYEKRLQFRAETKFANSIKKSVGVVRALAKEASKDKPEQAGEIVLCKTAEVPAYYGDGRDVLKKKGDGSEWLSGDRAIAQVKYRGQRIRVLALFEPDSEFAKKIDEYASHDEPEYAEGWVKITGTSEGTLKKNEIFVFDPRYNETEKIARFDFAAQKEYNEVLQTQIELEGLPEKPCPAKLKKGDLVYVLSRAGSLHRVQIPRLPYANKIAVLLDVHACDNRDVLCPACRTFGWVQRLTENQNTKRDKDVAYAGRLRFSHGQLQHQAKTIDEEIPLAILSSPKPTTTSFYLLDQNDKPSFNVDYNTEDAKLRGRKFYRHHGSSPNAQEYTRPNGKDGQPVCDGQNRTVKEVLARDNKFTFTLDFANLAPIELGALLWSLEMKYQDVDGQEQQLFHRLGFAKPLGFGSVQIEVDQVELLQPEKRYQSLQQDGKRVVPRAEWEQQCFAPFKAAMLSRYGRNADSFEALENVQDLIALLSAPKQCNHIHYPRPPYEDAPDKNIIKPNPEGKQFEWFVGNKKRNAKKFDFNPFSLPLAQEDVLGFELIDEDGNVHAGN